jgi:hypothetical protein
LAKLFGAFQIKHLQHQNKKTKLEIEKKERNLPLGLL